METGMSQQELHRVEVVALRRSGQISQAEAARRLRLTTRQVRRQHFDVRPNCAGETRRCRSRPWKGRAAPRPSSPARK